MVPVRRWFGGGGGYGRSGGGGGVVGPVLSCASCAGHVAFQPLVCLCARVCCVSEREPAAGENFSCGGPMDIAVVRDARRCLSRCVRGASFQRACHSAACHSGGARRWGIRNGASRVVPRSAHICSGDLSSRRRGEREVERQNLKSEYARIGRVARRHTQGPRGGVLPPLVFGGVSETTHQLDRRAEYQPGSSAPLAIRCRRT